ncbi:oxamate carbamoyltransferase subunit AllH family protein [Fundicoccus sp. Sow4_D5]|uniref:oxamate carbamoyltransferase subunit AllH family protein n=1 Tax=unclassified Fundicoccus TaxID=2761543 RepID=UPI003F8F20AD
MATKSFQQTLTSSFVISQYLADDLLGKQTHQQIKVHSVFPNGFNLDLQGQLIFVGKHGGDVSAFGLTLEASVFSHLQKALVVGQRVRITPTAWTFYSRPNLLQLVPGHVEKVAVDIVPITLEQLKTSALEESLEAANVYAQSGFALRADMTQLLEQYQAALQLSGDFLQPDLLRQFIGAGIGLTPSGDDFLQGMLLLEQAVARDTNLSDTVVKAALPASHHGQERPSYSLSDYVQTALQERSTTAVSQAYYQALFAGKVNLSWVKLLTAIKTDNTGQLKAAVQQIQAYGATSGNDILLGMLNVLKFI